MFFIVETPEGQAIINTDRINCILPTETGTEIHMANGLTLPTNAGFDEVVDMLRKDYMRKTQIETDTVKVKIVNSH